jgi:hypothetical protein
LSASSPAEAVLQLDAWFQRLRGGARGYGGPVSHWWHDSLVDCRPGYDWRYEGIVAGYLSLHQTTGVDAWLGRARQAGDDLLAAQLPSGHFRRSRFEQNPGVGGTPHEAAADTALLRLALALRKLDRGAAERYAEAAHRNLARAHVEELWDMEARAFRDRADTPSFVPNKACTLIEALGLLADITGDSAYLDEYAVPTAQVVLAHQIKCPGDRLDGAIAQSSTRGQIVAKYFPYYVARCVAGLLVVHRHTGDDRYADAALAAGRFVRRCRMGDGLYPQVVYADGRTNTYPRWVAPLGDVLLADAALAELGLKPLPDGDRALLQALLPSGGIRTAEGFASQGSQRPPIEPAELRDILPVAGWVDKAFRYLASRVGATDDVGPINPERALHDYALDCTFRGRRGSLQMGGTGVQLTVRGRSAYRWRYGADWADAEPWAIVR